MTKLLDGSTTLAPNPDRDDTRSTRTEVGTGYAVRGRGLVKTYAHGDTAVHALDHADLEVTAGTFTINGAQINIATTDTLQDVFDHIASATGNAVTACR